ncbi:MAG: dihydroorotate dehydrogenase-like protein [Spirochaetes bacterium]|uniref:Dihydroorotate dehydrogenase-like protein n=1 Tax=Candidatus Ornithospirochaeta stercoripullorum TaxID=2840899 RepID=A0A9D9E2F4_9SPIO|nr:dihydroorotate dehydrogenase-like protein [Candidatus Ornithospirochaeta stercoripullorum]
MIETTYMGLKLKSPVIISSGPLTQNMVSLKKAEEAGAGAVVLKSIFEEQINKDVSREMSENEEYLAHSDAGAFFASSARDYYIDRYMKLLAEAKKELSIPVIASVSAKSMDSWIDWAERFVKCGADAIELNYYPISSDASVSGEEVDKRFIDFAKKARADIDAPLSIKMGYKYSSLASLISSLDKIGIDGLVLFNRFFRPDIDIEKLEITAASPVSGKDEYAEALRWIGLMSGEVKADFAGNTGIHDGETAVKMMLSGAKAVEICTAVVQRGFGVIGEINRFIEEWMQRHGYSSTSAFIGLLSQEHIQDGWKWERTQFLKTIGQ